MNSSLAASVKPDESTIASHYRRVVLRRYALAGALLLLIVCSLLLDFTLGPSGMSVSTLWHTLVNASAADAGTRVIVWDIRLPFALMAVAVGMALGLAGAEMQTILNNPLASPFTLGVSSAASFGAALAIVLGFGHSRHRRQMVYSRQRLCLCAAGLLYSRRHQPLDPCRHLGRGAVRDRAGVYLQRPDLHSAVRCQRRYAAGAGLLDDGQHGESLTG